MILRLEEQHKSELDIYLGELAKWQSEADVLRKQLSENRMMVTKGNITLLKEMQEKDDKIHQLSYACQELQVSLKYSETYAWVLNMCLLNINTYFFLFSNEE